jgi:low temperature requirement protein LtrA
MAGLVLAAALWWIYFIAAAPMSESVLRASDGNPSLAYGLYAGGHLSPAFALLSMAAGVSLTLTNQATQAAAWFVTGGLTVYLFGSRVVFIGRPSGGGPPVLAPFAAVTVCIALLEPVISATGVVLVVAVWAAVIAAYVSWHLPGRLQGIAADPLSYFRPRPNSPPAQSPGSAEPSASVDSRTSAEAPPSTG